MAQNFIGCDVRSGAPAVAPIGSVERLEAELRHRVEHEPGQMILRQPLAQTGRQQQLLVTITRQEVLSHAEIVQTTPDSPIHVTAPISAGVRSSSRRCC
jgi:hypothetical protein